MKYLYLIIALALAVGVYLLCRKLQKKVDESSKLDELFNMKFVKGENGVNTKYKAFYDALVKKFGKEYKDSYRGYLTNKANEKIENEMKHFENIMNT